MHSRLDLPQTHLALRQSYRLGAWEEEKGVGGFQGSVAPRLDFLTTSVAFLSLIGKKSLNGLSPLVILGQMNYRRKISFIHT